MCDKLFDNNKILNTTFTGNLKGCYVPKLKIDKVIESIEINGDEYYTKEEIINLLKHIKLEML